MNVFFLKTDINGLLAETFRALEPQAKQKNIRYELTLPEVQLKACVDREALRKLFHASISDNIQSAKARVDVKLLPVETDDTLFTVEFSNDGQQSVPTAYARTPASNERNEQETIASSIFLVIDESPAAPLQKKHKQTRETTKAPVKPVLLLLEENKETVAYLNKALKQDYDMLRASTATEAMQFLAQENVQLVLAAAGLPTADGLSLCKHIKSNRLYSHIPVVLLTDPACPEAKVQGLMYGADAYTEKPLSMALLMLQMANLLRSRQLVSAYVTDALRMDAVTEKAKTQDHFMASLQTLIEEHISEIDLTVDMLAKLTNMSRPTLYRKVKQYTESTPNELIHMAKLKRAAELLTSKKYNITQIAAMVGYTAQSNFSRDFQKCFGTAPRVYGLQIGKQSGVA
ncbi:response regulator transcription factor [Sphingobacterium oryzagri]|uniref:Response regulator transcription factor n=1 Tax=Sphingobacterium oryzagri TaxID=3025669 RepID=A0ABY7WMB4_9SPHI|nr:response regulator transcription factor [Sphingobacterium sp. KACC 22765]WDF70729.1 response regulator transcription factor [Sphingobacterium sp. KACC 22765]